MIQISGHRVLVEADTVETTTESGIIFTTDEKLEKTGVQRGILVGVGPTAWQAFRGIQDGKEHDGRPWASVGDYVIFSRHAGKFIYDPFDEDKEYLVMNDEDILAVLHEGINPEYKTKEKVETNE